MRRAFAIVGATCLCVLACKRADVQRQLTPEQRLEEKYSGWAKAQPRPPQTIVDRVEAMLEEEPCVGNLNRWSRLYSYNYRPPTTDTGIVDFHLDEAGSYGVKPGRQITSPDSWVNIDDRRIKNGRGRLRREGKSHQVCVLRRKRRELQHRRHQ